MKKIPLTKGYEALVDDDDYDFLMRYKWYASVGSSTGTRVYARSRIKGKMVYMHKFIMNYPIGKVIDHIDNNPLNNQKSNLEAVTPLENMRRVPKFMNAQFKRKEDAPPVPELDTEIKLPGPKTMELK